MKFYFKFFTSFKFQLLNQTIKYYFHQKQTNFCYFFSNIISTFLHEFLIFCKSLFLVSYFYLFIKYIIYIYIYIPQHHNDVYFLSHQKERLSIFGIPLVIPHVGDGSVTGRELYERVWGLVGRLLTPQQQVARQQGNHAADWLVVCSFFI